MCYEKSYIPPLQRHSSSYIKEAQIKQPPPTHTCCCCCAARMEDGAVVQWNLSKKLWSCCITTMSRVRVKSFSATPSCCFSHIFKCQVPVPLLVCLFWGKKSIKSIRMLVIRRFGDFETWAYELVRASVWEKSDKCEKMLNAAAMTEVTQLYCYHAANCKGKVKLWKSKVGKFVEAGSDNSTW